MTSRGACVAAILATMTATAPAGACPMRTAFPSSLFPAADVVVIGKISNYRRIHEHGPMALFFRQPGVRYARFDITVDKVLKGRSARKLSVTLHSNMFGEPRDMPPGPFLVALNRPDTTSYNLDKNSAMARLHPTLLTVSQASCTEAAILDPNSPLAAEARDFLTGKRVFPSRR